VTDAEKSSENQRKKRNQGRIVGTQKNPCGNEKEDSQTQKAEQKVMVVPQKKGGSKNK